METSQLLRESVTKAYEALIGISDQKAAESPAPGKWSPKQVIGHLIDSATNNHHRFVRANFKDNLVFAGYQQEEWVDAQHYQTAPWENLLQLFLQYNLHLAWVIQSTPLATRMEMRSDHNLNLIAWKAVPVEEPTNLEYLMRDYVNHMNHHLSQIRF